MDFDPYFRLVEASGLSTWLRSSTWAFPAVVTLHTLGMGLLAGPSAIIDIRVLGFAKGVPLRSLARFAPLLWSALGVNVVSGLLLLVAYPTKALTNPVFAAKLALIAFALGVQRTIHRQILDAPGLGEAPLKLSEKALAVFSLVFWAGAIFAGRLHAYTHTRLLVDLRVHF
jgi:hypothetical protein